MPDVIDTQEVTDAKKAVAFIAECDPTEINVFIVVNVDKRGKRITAGNICCEYHMVCLLADLVSDRLNECLAPCCGGGDSCG